MPKDIEPSSSNAPIFEGGQQRVVVNNRPACDINKKRIRFHASKFFLSNETARIVVQWWGDDHKIRLA